MNQFRTISLFALLCTMVISIARAFVFCGNNRQAVQNQHRCSARQSLRWHTNIRSTLTTRIRTVRYQTPYTINDSICPPTDRDVLRSVVSKHVETLDRYTSQKPIAAHTMESFQAVKEWMEQSTGKLEGIIMDSGCGTAKSTLVLGKRYPNHFVIGIDKSLARLSRNEHFEADDTTTTPAAIQRVSGSPNVVLVRAELSDFWRCCVNHQWTLDKHYLLYPNPYPKKARLKSRWYAHPAMPLILKLGGDIIVRSNWEGFLQEFALSIQYASDTIKDGDENYAQPYVQSLPREPVPLSKSDTAKVPWTNFEKKYIDCGEPIYELQVPVAR